MENFTKRMWSILFFAVLIVVVYVLYKINNPRSSERASKLRRVRSADLNHRRVDSVRTRCNVSSGCADRKRACVHVVRAVQLEDGDVITANEKEDEGYCLVPEKRERPLSCDPRFGEPAATVTQAGRVRSTCRCYWPTLFDKTDDDSDCSSVVRACGGTGDLIHSGTKRPLHAVATDDLPIRDIHEYECRACGGNGGCLTPGRDPHTGLPSCVPSPVKDRKRGLCLYEELAVTHASDAVAKTATEGRTTTATVIPVDSVFVSDTFAAAFADDESDERGERYVPNPCAFDAFRGVRLAVNDCRLALSPSGVGFCEPLSETVSTVIYDDDYLPKNGGRYSNACFKFTESDANVDAYVVEYFVRPPATGPGERQNGTPPLPVVSMEIEAGKLMPEVLDAINARETTGSGGTKKLLISQSEIPGDVESVPVPFDKHTMSRFVDERNDFVFYIPAKYSLFHLWAPVQRVRIPYCDDINGERDVSGFTDKVLDSNEYNLEKQRHVVACREPRYDRRLPVVPNVDVNPLGPAYNANPTSAVLRFDKSDSVVRPYWYRSYFNNEHEVKAYVSLLPSRPPPV